MNGNKYVIGVDFGTDSVRSLIVNAVDGSCAASSVVYYPRWKAGLYCDAAANRYRQHPLDYIESLERAIRGALADCDAAIVDRIVGLSFDTTASTPVLTDRYGTPLALLERYAENPNAMFVLWKDHTAIEEADRINDVAHACGVDYTKYSGGSYSCEWAWAKVLHLLREDASLRTDAYSWIEHCDWMSALLTGNTLPANVVRSRCAAGHKAMWHAEWGGLPPQEFLAQVDPLLAGFGNHLYGDTFVNGKCVGGLSVEWAARLGLHEGIAVGLGAIDCHVGAIGAGIRPGTLVKIVGTSTCDIMAIEPEIMGGRIIRGICGQVDGSVLPDHVGLEAGQSAFGDIYAWFRNLMCWPLRNIVDADPQAEGRILDTLNRQAAQIVPGTSALLALDWMNGRRTPDADPRATGLIGGITLATSAPAIFRALVEATAFGSRAITERLVSDGVVIRDVVAVGGIARKSPLVMQIIADVLGVPIRIAASDQACALGAAMCASVAAGLHASIADAQQAMGQGFDCTYAPDKHNSQIYEQLYGRYKQIGAAFGE